MRGVCAWDGYDTIDQPQNEFEWIIFKDGNTTEKRTRSNTLSILARYYIWTQKKREILPTVTGCLTFIRYNCKLIGWAQIKRGRNNLFEKVCLSEI